MKKAVWVVRVDNYRPDICEKTFPSLEAYAKSLGASFNVITERRWPAATPPYEKLQVYDLGKDNDWNVIVDADLMIGNMYDISMLCSPYKVSSWMVYDVRGFFPIDDYYTRDDRYLGASFNFLVVPKACRDALQPFPDEEIPMRLASIQRPFMLDEYCLSRNIARFGLKHSGILTINLMANPPFKHFYATSAEESAVTLGRSAIRITS